MSYPEKIFRIFFVSDLVMVVLFVVASFLTVDSFSVLKVLLDPDGEANLFSWYSSSKLMLIAFIFFLVFFFTDGSRIAAIVIMAGTLAMSADEAAMLHERIGYEFSVFRRGLANATPGDWPRLYALPIILATLVALYWAIRSTVFDRASRMMLILGFSIIAIGAFGMEVIAIATRPEDHLIIGPTPAIVLVEEILENLGATILVAVAVRIVQMHTKLDRRAV